MWLADLALTAAGLAVAFCVFKFVGFLVDCWYVDWQFQRVLRAKFMEQGMSPEGAARASKRFNAAVEMEALRVASIEGIDEERGFAIVDAFSDRLMEESKDWKE